VKTADNPVAYSRQAAPAGALNPSLGQRHIRPAASSGEKTYQPDEPLSHASRKGSFTSSSNSVSSSLVT